MAPAPSADRSEAIASAALAWHVRTKDPGASAADHRALQEWLAADPAHARAYTEAEVLWSQLAQPAAILAAEGWHRRRPRRARNFAFATAAALLLALGLAGWRDPGLGARLLADHAAAPGTTHAIRLDDGSRLLLDGDSAVDVSPGRVTLHHGRIWIEAPAADLVVSAGTATVRRGDALSAHSPARHNETRQLCRYGVGTAFAVTRQDDQVEITVASGRVAVNAPQLAATVELQRDQVLRLAPGNAAAPQQVSADTALAWRRGLLIFDRAPLAEVAAELDRVLPGRVWLNDAARTQTVSGVFRRDDPAAMLAALRDGLGIEIIEVPGLAVLLRR